MHIQTLNHDDPAIRERIFAYLAPHEAFGLFILGNLNTHFPGTHLYAAVEDERWLGLAGYYASLRSAIPFALDSQAAATLVEHVLTTHGDLEWLLGAPAAAGPGLGLLCSRGFTVLNQPRHVFMEAPLGPNWSPLRSPHEDRARFMGSGDGEAVARLLRILRDPTNQAPLTERELAQAQANALRMVIEEGGRLVATAATNGLGIRAFQILGVVTHPDCRRQGYARAVCLALMRHMHGLGGRHCVLFTDVNNLAAQRCYEGIGFQATGDFIVARLRAPAVDPRRSLV